MQDPRNEAVATFRAEGATPSDIDTLPRLGTFMRLSRVLLGADELALELPEELGRTYHATLVAAVGWMKENPDAKPQYSYADIEATLDAFERIAASNPPDLEEVVREGIVAAPGQTSVVAKTIISLWYCAAIIDLTPGAPGFISWTAPKQTYGQALIWKTFGGNPMGIPGPYYGNWAYPSTVPVAPPEGSEDTHDKGAAGGAR
jgi:hypothetical protein